MNLLAIETSSTGGSIALSSGDKIVAASYLDIRSTHSERVLPQIDGCLTHAEMRVEDLDGILISNGPGSFTGLRIGLATAKGLSLAHEIPLLPMSTVEIVGYNVYGSAHDILVLLDAKMGEVHAALFSPAMDVLEPVFCDTIEHLLQRWDRPLTVVGEGALRYRPEITAADVPWRFALTHQHHPQATVMVSIALAGTEFPAYDFGRIAALEPFYLRKSQAEVVREKRMAEATGK